MNDELNNKVIHIFQHHRRGEHDSVGHHQTDHSPDHSAMEHKYIEIEEGGELILSPDGFNYVSLKQEQGGLTDETCLQEVAEAKHYIIKMMEVHHDNHSIRLNNYHVPGERLEEFLRSLPQRPGKILEIKQFIPDHMA